MALRGEGSSAARKVWVAIVGLAMVVGASGLRATVVEVEASSTYAGERAEIEALAERVVSDTAFLLGLRDPGPRILVRIEEERSALDRGLPDWVAGLAYGASGEVILFPDRSPTYPATSRQEVFVHEIAHVLTFRAAGFRSLPRWFSEGVAMHAASPWGLQDRAWTTVAFWRHTGAGWREIDALFAGDESDVRSAYALSGALTRAILREAGPTALARILREVRRGRSFDEAIAAVAGQSPHALLTEFWENNTWRYRWLPLLTSSTAAWAGISLLAVVAGWRRKKLDAELYERWREEEDRARDGGWSTGDWRASLPSPAPRDRGLLEHEERARRPEDDEPTVH